MAYPDSSLLNATVRNLLTFNEVKVMLENLHMLEREHDSLPRFKVRGRIYYIAEHVMKTYWGMQIVAPKYPVILLSEYDIIHTGLDFNALCKGLWSNELPIYSRCGNIHVDPRDIESLTVEYSL